MTGSEINDDKGEERENNYREDEVVVIDKG